MTGRLIAIVGPSGVGKDSVMEGLVATYPGYRLARRVITRAPDAGGEDYDPVTETQFQQMAGAGEFVLHWQAHGLWYGVPHRIAHDIADGHAVLVNLSRKVLPAAMAQFPGAAVVVLSASPAVLAQRLASRGRETAAEIEKRLAQADMTIPEGVPHMVVENEGSLDQTLRNLHAALQPESDARCS